MICPIHVDHCPNPFVDIWPQPSHIRADYKNVKVLTRLHFARRVREEEDALEWVRVHHLQSGTSMNFEQTNTGENVQNFDGSGDQPEKSDHQKTNRYRDEVFSRRVPAGKRTYFFDVKTTRSGEDYFVTITESKRVDEDRYEKHKIFLYKEDFGKFVAALHEVVQHIVDERLPEYDFRNLPELNSTEEEMDARDGGEY